MPAKMLVFPASEDNIYHARNKMIKAWLLFIAFTVFAMVCAPPVSATPYYVTTNGTGAGTSWTDALGDIQSAITKAVNVGDEVWVSNGVYATGGITNSLEAQGTTNRVSITNAGIIVRSAHNDPVNTIIQGGGTYNTEDAIRCVYMNNNTTLIGFTLTNGATKLTGLGAGVLSQSTNTVISNCVMVSGKAGYNGGGAYAGTLYNCTITNNLGGANAGGVQAATLYNCSIVNNNGGNSCGGARASTLYNCLLKNNMSHSAGGALDSTLYNCVIINNSTDITDGGGIKGGSIYNCTVVSNRATTSGGGVSTAGVYNSIVYFNTALSGPNWADIYGATNCCTTPAASGVKNITDDPMFVNTNMAAVNYRLNPNSPCINTGTNFAWMLDPADARSKDLDGRMRVRYGTVDMGAYEKFYSGTMIKFH